MKGLLLCSFLCYRFSSLPFHVVAFPYKTAVWLLLVFFRWFVCLFRVFVDSFRFCFVCESGFMAVLGFVEFPRKTFLGLFFDKSDIVFI